MPLATPPAPPARIAPAPAPVHRELEAATRAVCRDLARRADREADPDPGHLRALRPRAAELARAYAEGISWADAKQVLFERIEREIAPMREQYQALISDPARIESILLEGALKARALAAPFNAKLRHAVGLRKLSAAATPAKESKAEKAARPAFKQYRERDGKFYFKLVDVRGRLLLQSSGFESPKEAAQMMALLTAGGEAALADHAACLTTPADVSAADVVQALQALASPTL